MWRRIGFTGLFLTAAVLPTSMLHEISPRQTSHPLPRLGILHRARVLVVAPHPDDEVIGTGVWLAQSTGPKLVVLLTAGDGYGTSARVEAMAVRRAENPYLHLGRLRIRELYSSLSLLSPGAHVLTLGYPDQSLSHLLLSYRQDVYEAPGTQRRSVRYGRTPHPGELHTGDHLYRDVVRAIDTFRPDVLLYPCAYDQHSDHATAAALVDLALVNSRSSARGYQYLVHWPLWPTPLGYHPSLLLQPPTRLSHPDCRIRWLAARSDDRVRRRLLLALGAHRSQVRLLTPFLTAFVRRNALFADLSPLLPGTTIVEPRVGGGGTSSSLAWGRCRDGNSVWAHWTNDHGQLRPHVLLQSIAVRHGSLVFREQPLRRQPSALPEWLRCRGGIVRVVVRTKRRKLLVSAWRRLPPGSQNSRRPSSERINVTSSA
jgi:LmbE family N-acetylglucosaminyl deacetylase